MQPDNINYSELLFWTDAQISSSIAKWLKETFHVQAASVKMLQLITADDEFIYMAARKVNAILISKYRDISLLLNRRTATKNNLAYLWQYIQQSEDNSAK